MEGVEDINVRRRGCRKGDDVRRGEQVKPASLDQRALEGPAVF